MRLLLVEDEVGLAETIPDGLAAEGFVRTGRGVAYRLDPVGG
jgi:hypothetical protein